MWITTGERWLSPSRFTHASVLTRAVGKRVLIGSYDTLRTSSKSGDCVGLKILRTQFNSGGVHHWHTSISKGITNAG